MTGLVQAEEATIIFIIALFVEAGPPLLPESAVLLLRTWSPKDQYNAGRMSSGMWKPKKGSSATRPPHTSWATNSQSYKTLKAKDRKMFNLSGSDDFGMRVDALQLVC